MGTVLSTQAHVTVPAGSYDACVETEDTSALEPNVREHKFYCRGVGLVRERESARAGSELTGITAPSPTH